MRLYKFALLVILITSGCTSDTAEKKEVSWSEFYKSDLFIQVQTESIFPDSKTFTDCTAKRPLSEILTDYNSKKSSADFNLKSFLEENFEIPGGVLSSFESDTSRSMKEHINLLWEHLTREPDQVSSLSSLIALPQSYVVPGGRFREIYYWDSFFTMEGLMVSGRRDLAENMVRNFAYLIDTIGFIPNGNRAYYLGRSQPPFFSCMVDLLASNNRDLYISFLPEMQKEYDFWMSGSDNLTKPGKAVRRVVKMPDGTILNRYWDDFPLPRPESYKEDVIVAKEIVSTGNESAGAEEKFRHLRAGAESGWDFSSRWFADHNSIATIHTTDIVPVDLNALLYFLELKLAQGYDWQGDQERARYYLGKATDRKAAINKYLWDDESSFYIDYDFVNDRGTGVLSLAASFPLYFKIADKAKAKKVMERLQGEFLQDGGFVTTLNKTGQQWDWPNGWAPLQWITINGLYNYEYNDLGNEGAQRWLSRNEEVFKATGKMMEKYNVVDISLLAGGGEYALQDGFGWTNGVALAMMKIFEEKEMVDEMRGDE
ncbi:alpha,alpha-trehalase TreF [Fulvivirga sedimenti]|uniref:Alpha,alpha-trehalase TreF n=1 Tax=Fulvivirga sedimenti TaxID=2879465 RepID=A0A9X1HYX8_9BACT|nr:alpha,alpha-trehalase TreF [Fulvivirga sedimenti]MCA6079177.1 alpha,alpha-trehalase TreF [Fulvivirga sedimenti]